jgi:hypothetical protein
VLARDGKMPCGVVGSRSVVAELTTSKVRAGRCRARVLARDGKMPCGVGSSV